MGLAFGQLGSAFHAEFGGITLEKMDDSESDTLPGWVGARSMRHMGLGVSGAVEIQRKSFGSCSPPTTYICLYLLS